jgi:hypothetical protein
MIFFEISSFLFKFVDPLLMLTPCIIRLKESSCHLIILLSCGNSDQSLESTFLFLCLVVCFLVWVDGIWLKIDLLRFSICIECPFFLTNMLLSPLSRHSPLLLDVLWVVWFLISLDSSHYWILRLLIWVLSLAIQIDQTTLHAMRSLVIFAITSSYLGNYW